MIDDWIFVELNAKMSVLIFNKVLSTAASTELLTSTIVEMIANVNIDQ